MILWAIGAVALVLGRIYRHLAPFHYVVAVILLVIWTFRLLRRLDA